MQNNMIFYKCENIYEELTVVIREILSKELNNVVINIHIGDEISKILNFFNERKFKYTFDEDNKNLPKIRIVEEVTGDNSKANFYISCEKFKNKEELFKLDELNNYNYKCFTFNNLDNVIIDKIHDANYKINNYSIDFIDQLLIQNTLDDSMCVKDKDIIENHLVNEQIRNKFLETFFIAEDEIDIISPWISNNVVDKKLIELMESALKRGVKIKILYGIGNDDRSKKTDIMAEQLIQCFSKYDKLFTMKKTNTHYKLLICDDKFAISGSYNLLSFRGDYDYNDNRSEGAEYINNKETIIKRREYYFNF